MNLLVLAVLLPFAGAVVLGCLGRAPTAVVRYAALAVTLVTLALVGKILLARPLAEVDLPWLARAGIDVRFSLGLDGLSLWMFGLTALLMVTCVLVSWQAVAERVASFYALLLVLESGMLGVFAARDIILFYIFFEFTLIPLFFLIGIWGSEERRYAAIKFFLYTLAGSVLTFLGLLAIVVWNYSQSGNLTFAIGQLLAGLAEHPIDRQVQLWIFLALFAGFAIKVPLFPLHTWLPLAHVQAPSAGSVLLAGVLLKVGAYGFLRFSLPMLPQASADCMPWVLWLSAAGIIYGALVALVQTDIKRLIAYSSVSHLGYCMLGLFAANRLGVQGGTLQMVNHGLSTGGLFALVGMLYERYHTREIRRLGGLARRTPILALFMLIFTFSSIGLPGLNGFAGEFLLLAGMFQRAWTAAPPGWQLHLQAITVLAVLGVVLGAWYMLWLVQRVFFGPLREPHDHAHAQPIADMNLREVLALAPLVVFMVWIGVAPHHFLEPMSDDLNKVAAAVEPALAPPALLPTEPVPAGPARRTGPLPHAAAAALRSGTDPVGMAATVRGRAGPIAAWSLASPPLGRIHPETVRVD